MLLHIITKGKFDRLNSRSMKPQSFVHNFLCF